MVYNDSKTKAKHRRRIVKYAKKLFVENGIAQTTITDICNLCEIERQTFYNYFENKDEIAQYVYIQNLQEFYSDGLSDNNYVDCETGYDKVKKYFDIVSEKYFHFYLGTVFLVHYDYYFQREPDMKLVSKIYNEYNVIDPSKYFKEGLEDGSILSIFDNPAEYFYILTQSFGAYANRIIFRSYNGTQENLELQKNRLKIMINSQLEAMKAN